MKPPSAENPGDSADIVEALTRQLQRLLPGKSLDSGLDRLSGTAALQALQEVLLSLENRLDAIQQAVEQDLLTDVERSRELEVALHRARMGEGRAQAILDMAMECIITIDSRGIIQFFNHASERMFGFEAAEVMGRNVSCLMPEPYKSAHDSYLQRYLATLEPHIIGIGRAIVAQRKDGGTFPAELAVNPFSVDDETYFVGTLHDISARVAAECSLRQVANTDALTGLLNRKGLMEGLKSSLDKATGKGLPLGVIYIDMDNFKPVNDTLAACRT